MTRELITIVGKTRFQVNDPKSPYYKKVGVLLRELTEDFYNFSDSWVLLKFEDGTSKSISYEKLTKLFDENIGRHILLTDGPFAGAEAIITKEDNNFIWFDCLPNQGVPEIWMKGHLDKVQKT